MLARTGDGQAWNAAFGPPKNHMRLTGLHHSLLWLCTGANIAAGRQAGDQLDGQVTESSALIRGEVGEPKARKGEGAAGDAAGAAPAAPADWSLQGLGLGITSFWRRELS